VGVGVGDDGDLVLAPQQLAHVFKCVITCNSETTRRASHQLLVPLGAVGVRDVRLEGEPLGRFGSQVTQSQA
jgi:hypothetical protein